MVNSTPKDLLASAGVALCGGPFWQAELARLLQVSDRTMRHWTSGDRAPSHGDIWIALLDLIETRRRDLKEIGATIRAEHAAAIRREKRLQKERARLRADVSAKQ